MPLSFAPFGWWWLAPLAYAALLTAWRGATPRAAFISGFSFGAGEFLFGIYWIYISVHEIAGAPLFVAVLLMLGLVFVMALYPAIVGWVTARWFGTRGIWCWLGVIPALLVLSEWLRGWLFTGFGWLSPGYAQTESWLLGLAPVLGVLGVSWAVFFLAGVLVAIAQGTRRSRVGASIAAAVLFAVGFVLDHVAWTEPTSNAISVALVQGAVPQELKWMPEQLEETKDLYRSLTVEALGSDLIIWPEAAIPDYYEIQARWVDEIGRMAADAGSAMMLGMLRFHPAGAQNAVYTIGQPGSVYVKRHLVPYGEYFPVPSFIDPWLQSMNLAFIDTHPGDSDQPPVELLGERVAVTICYEDVFGAEQLGSFPEATLLVNVSNDAWFGDSLAPHQHLQIARMRSAEVRRWQLRATNTGLTAVIDPLGSVDAQLTQFEPGILRATVTGFTGTTPYILWGNWAVVLLATAVLVVYLATTKLTIRPGT